MFHSYYYLRFSCGSLGWKKQAWDKPKPGGPKQKQPLCFETSNRLLKPRHTEGRETQNFRWFPPPKKNKEHHLPTLVKLTWLYWRFKLFPIGNTSSKWWDLPLPCYLHLRSVAARRERTDRLGRRAAANTCGILSDLDGPMGIVSPNSISMWLSHPFWKKK